MGFYEGFDKERAAYIAPAIRMLLGKSGYSIKTLAAEKNYDLTGKKAVTVKKYEDIEEQYGALQKAINEYNDKNGEMPVYVAIEDFATFAAGASKKEANANADKLLGGKGEFAPATCYERIADKIIIVTGSAQGFGQGIAEELLKAGGCVVIADLNFELAEKNCAELAKTYGERIMPCKVDVTSEESTKEMVIDTVLEFGGLDTYVNNAGIAKAGNLEEMTLQTLEFTNKVNYNAYFLGSKYASRIMKIQHRFNKNYYADIVQVNSKSGLAGSNKNFAYAGSKFGSIGLTQSFALELVEYNIKVNSVCPGNYFEGPLWSDPEKGLFVQYLNAGKIPGAKTVADVKKAYESKVPMNRGCWPEDVAKAILYCMEQKYETGQAIPVTGGQIMLK